MSEYDEELASDVWMKVRFETEHGRLTSYAVALAVEEDGEWTTLRLYDNAHGAHEMHRYNRSGAKRSALVVHHGSSSEALNAAIAAVRDGFEEIVRVWRWGTR